MIAILRWPLVLILVVLVASSFLPALATAAAHINEPSINAIIDNLAASSPAIGGALEYGQQGSWLEAGLWFTASLFFLVCAIRLIRRTQGFWAWLLGFACYGARWAVTQQSEGGVVSTLQSLTPDSLNSDQLTAASPPVQVGLLAFHLVVGLLILIVDAVDRAHWDRHEHGH